MKVPSLLSDPFLLLTAAQPIRSGERAPGTRAAEESREPGLNSLRRAARPPSAGAGGRPGSGPAGQVTRPRGEARGPAGGARPGRRRSFGPGPGCGAPPGLPRVGGDLLPGYARLPRAPLCAGSRPLGNQRGCQPPQSQPLSSGSGTRSSGIRRGCRCSEKIKSL